MHCKFLTKRCDVLTEEISVGEERRKGGERKGEVLVVSLRARQCQEVQGRGRRKKLKRSVP